jgi:hypothetical protein
MIYTTPNVNNIDDARRIDSDDYQFKKLYKGTPLILVAKKLTNK